MTGGIPQRARRPSRSTANRRHREALLRRLPRPGALVRAGLTGLRQNLGAALALSAVALVAGGAFLAYRWVTTSTHFAVATIDVAGNQRVAATTLRGALAGALGQNLIALDLGGLEAALERVPRIAHAEIRRELPDRLLVTVVEHQPAAVVELGELYLADADGRLFARAHAETDDLAGLPIITGLERAVVARDPDAAAARITVALGLAAAWAGAPRPPLGEIHLDDDRGVTLYLLDPALAIELGAARPADLASRLPSFDAAWAALDAPERARATSIHLGRGASSARVTVAFAER